MRSRFLSMSIVMMLSLGPFATAIVPFHQPDIDRMVCIDSGFEDLGCDDVPSIKLEDVEGRFTENLGQKGEGAGMYYCEGDPMSVAFGTGWVAFDYHPDAEGKAVMYRMSFESTNLVEPVGMDPLEHKSNYFIGNDPDRWVSGARSYRKVMYQDLFDGIDLVFDLTEDRLKYEFRVAPGSDPSAIRMVYEGIEGLGLDERTGELLIQTGIGSIRDEAPFSYQDTSTEVIEVDSIYRVLDERSIAIGIDDYDPSRPLILDPGLEFSTYLGESRGEDLHDIIFDEDDNLLAAAQTESATFPTTPGAYSRTKDSISTCVIFKMSGDGKDILYSTFVGGNSQEDSFTVALDDSNNIYMNGYTQSTDFPTTAGAIQSTNKGDFDLFFLILDSTGSDLLYSTYIGGSDWESAFTMSVDGAYDVYLAGTTKSSDFPMVAGGFNTTHYGSERAVFALKIDISSKKLAYSTYLGGGEASKNAVDDAGCIFVKGDTNGGIPTTGGAYQTQIMGDDDGFVSTLSADGSKLLYSTYLGGSDKENLWWGDIMLDSQGNPIISGYTWSDDFPTTPGAYDTSFAGGAVYEYDMFIAKLNASLDHLIWSTYFGGNDADEGASFDLDMNDTVFFALMTFSSDLETSTDAYCSTFEGVLDAYVGRLDSSGQTLVYGTYLGGSDDDRPYTILRGIENTTVAGVTSSSDFPTTSGAYDETYNSANGIFDMFVTRLETGPPSVIYGTVPTVPLNFTVETGDRSATLSWEPPADDGNLSLKGYRIYHGLASDSLAHVGTILRTQTSYRHSPTDLGVTNYYAVSAFNILGEGNLSEVESVVPYGTPSMPRDLEATPGCGTVDLTWSSPQDLGGLEVLGYTILRGPTRYDMTFLTTLGNVTEYTDTGLENARTYHYSLFAFNDMGNGTMAIPVQAMPRGPPGAPWDLRVTPGDSMVDLSWRTPLNDGGSSVLGFRVLRGTSASALEEYATKEGYETDLRDLDLENGVTYYYAVMAFNLIGDGPLSKAVNATPRGYPGIPRALEITAGDGQVNLTWEEPEMDGGSRILFYNIYRGSDENSLAFLANTTALLYTDTGLQNGRAYYYAVQAVNGVGPSYRTSPRQATPVGLASPPMDLYVEEGVERIDLNWGSPIETGGSAISSYVIYRGEGPDSLVFHKELDDQVTAYVDLEVTIGTVYHYSVAARTKAGEGQRCAAVTGMAIGYPGIPLALSAEAGDGEVLLTWQPPEDDGESPIIGYVLMSGTSMARLTELVQLGDVTTYLDTSVMNDQTYLYIVASINEAGVGEYSEPVEATPFRPATCPGKVLTFVGDSKGTKVTLQWTAPDDDGGSPVTGYVVLRGDSPGNISVVATLGVVTVFSEGDLQRGTTYYYSVAAINDVGQGEPIATYEVKIPKKKQDEPGFVATVLVAAMALAIPLTIAGRRRGSQSS